MEDFNKVVTVISTTGKKKKVRFNLYRDYLSRQKDGQGNKLWSIWEAPKFEKKEEIKEVPKDAEQAELPLEEPKEKTDNTLDLTIMNVHSIFKMDLSNYDIDELIKNEEKNRNRKSVLKHYNKIKNG